MFVDTECEQHKSRPLSDCVNVFKKAIVYGYVHLQDEN